MKKAAKICLVLLCCGVLMTGAVYTVLRGSTPAVISDEKSREEALTEALALSRKAEEALAQGSAEERKLPETGGLVLTGSGIYRVSGSMKGQLTVQTEGEVVLILDGVQIENPNGAALEAVKTRHLHIYLPEGADNTLLSGTAHEITGTEDTDDASGAALHAEDDLSLSGPGKLTAAGYINNAVATADHLVILSGDITAIAAHTGLKGKDSVTVLDGKITVESGGDGIKSDNDTDGGCGIVLLSGGSIRISSFADGMQAAQLLKVTGGEVDIVSGGGSGQSGTAPDEDGRSAEDAPTPPQETEKEMQEPPAMPGEGQGGFDPGRQGGFGPGGQGGFDPNQQGGFDPNQQGGFDPRQQGGFDPRQQGGFDPSQKPGRDTPGEQPAKKQSGGTGESAKGLKSDAALEITGGLVTVDAADDALHAVCLTVSGGELKLASADDGLHADDTLEFTGGSVTVSASYEGAEGRHITVSGGEILLVSRDDGFNANGGSAAFARLLGETGDLPSLTISGGTVYVNAGGDGLDSNGDLLVSGGTVVVDGPADNGNGALDAGTENGGELRITGGTVLAIGGSGMAETFTGSSSQCSFLLTLPQSAAAGSSIMICSEDGTVLFEHTSAKAFSSVVFSCPALYQGGTWTVTVAGETYEVTQNAVSAGSGSRGFGGRS